MRCDEVLTRAAELDGADAAVERHLADCGDCRGTLDAAREARDALLAFEADDAETPPADARAAWHAARPAPRRASTLLARAAALLLAAAGGFALAAARSPSLERADVEAAVDGAIGRLSARLDERDRARAAAMEDVADQLDERRRDDVAALVEQVVALRRELVAARMVQESFADAAFPALRDPR